MFNSYLEEIKTYEAGKPIELVVREFGIEAKDVVKLASNENPYGCSPRVIEAIQKGASRASLYPDDSMYELKAALSDRFGVGSENIIIGAGSDQVLEFISHVKLHQNAKILRSAVSFAMYDIYAKQFGAKIVTTPSYEHKVDEFQKKIESDHPDIIYICTPNNPTGDATKREDIFAIINAAPKESLVVIDGAYMEYVESDHFRVTPKEILEFKNVVYLGTFSKAFGLGGMRIGYGIAHKDIIDVLYKVRPPFNITTLSLLAAIEASKDFDFVKMSVAKNREEMLRYEKFAKEYALEYIPSQTNFITYLFDASYNSSTIATNLMKQGVIIRDLASYGLNAVRITIGRPEQNSRLFEVLKREIE